MVMAGSIFEPQPQNFGKSDNFWTSTNYITNIFGNFYYHKSLKKCTRAIRPGMEESLPRYLFNPLLPLKSWNEPTKIGHFESLESILEVKN